MARRSSVDEECKKKKPIEKPPFFENFVPFFKNFGKLKLFCFFDYRAFLVRLFIIRYDDLDEKKLIVIFINDTFVLFSTTSYILKCGAVDEQLS